MLHILSFGALAFYLYKYFRIFSKNIIFIILNRKYKYTGIVKLLEIMQVLAFIAWTNL